MKKTLATAMLIIPMVFAGCSQGASGDEKKLSTIFTDMVCLAHAGTTAAESAKTDTNFDMKAFRDKMDKDSEELEKLMKSSFAKEEDMKNAYKGLKDKAAFQKSVGESAGKKCQASKETLDKVFEEVNGDLE
jgi:hypothetical protein